MLKNNSLFFINSLTLAKFYKERYNENSFIYAHHFKEEIMKKLIPFLSAFAIASLVFPMNSQAATSRQISPIISQGESFSDSHTIKQNNDQLFSDYLDSLLENDRATLQSNYGEKYLSAYNKNLYQILKTNYKDIADGKINNTKISIPLNELFPDTQITFTAAQLDLPYLIDDSGKLHPNLGNSIDYCIREKYNLDVRKTIFYLTTDCPYELYWYDKEIGFTSKFEFMSGVSVSTDSVSINLSTVKLNILMAVSEDYKAANPETESIPTSDGGQKTFILTTNSAKTAIALNSVNNANAIIEKHKAKEDYEKLLAYRNEICQLTSYDEQAMEQKKYGDPWQFIYVFDDDPETKVVCEGYSKAFQYLCDHSDFQSDLIACYTVTGNLTTPSGGGAHMWSLVRMDDGKTYLTDITNSDSIEESYGKEKIFYFLANVDGLWNSYNAFAEISSDSYIKFKYEYDQNTKDLFPSSVLSLSTTHSWANEPSKVVEPTCTKTGSETYECIFCPVTESKTIPMKNHSFKRVYARATLTASGYEAQKCSVCKLVKDKVTFSYPKTISLSKTALVYTGKAQKPSITIKGANEKIIASSNYSLSLPSGTNVGKYTVKVTFKGNYSGSKTLYYKINPKPTSIVSLTPSTKAFAVKWTKITTQTSGYQIQYATNTKFDNAKTVTITSNTTLSKKIGSLTAKKKYFVRVRTYKTVGSTKYYSSWCTPKYVTTK